MLIVTFSSLQVSTNYANNWLFYPILYVMCNFQQHIAVSEKPLFRSKQRTDIYIQESTSYHPLSYSLKIHPALPYAH